MITENPPRLKNERVTNMSYFSAVKNMHTKFDIHYEGFPRELEREEYIFRIGAMIEEIIEYASSVFDFESGEDNASDVIRKVFTQMLSQAKMRDDTPKEERLEDQFDALIDLTVFALGTAQWHGFNFDEGFKRVMKANMQKRVAESSDESKRNFEKDLVKPEGWKPPVLSDLVKPPTGVIVLEGPDGTGKTTLAKYLVNKFNGVYFHNSWSSELEKDMENYILSSIQHAQELSKDRLIIIDRSWISEFIYSDVFRSGTNWPKLACKARDMLEELNAVYIFCIPEDDNKEKYFEQFKKLTTERKEMYNTMTNCYSAYETMLYGYEPHNGLNYKFKNIDPLIGIWHDNSGIMGSVDFIVYDRFNDSSYFSLNKALNQVFNTGNTAYVNEK